MGQAIEQFQLLLANVFEAPDQQMVYLADAATDVAGQVLLFGVDPREQLHILAPVSTSYAYRPQKSERIELTEWEEPDTGARYLDLVCRDDKLTRVFSQLADGVVDRLSQVGERCHTALGCVA